LTLDEEPMKKTMVIALAAMFAVSSGTGAAQAAHHHKKIRRPAARSATMPAPRAMPSTATKQPCPIRGMGTSNWFGTENDFNVYRDRPECY
jgi:hypothetical protein